MKCEDLQLNLSIYLDNILSGEEQVIVDEHLAKCPLCRQKLSDFQLLRRELRILPRPEAPTSLTAELRRQAAVKANKERPYRLNKNFREWLQMRLMPYSVGTVTTLILGFALLWTLLSAANNPPELAKYEPNKAVMLTNPGDLDLLNDVELSPADFAAARISVAGDSPSVNPQGALVALTKSILRGKMKDEEVVVVADVFGDGLAQISQVVEPSKDRQAVRELKRALETNPDYAPPFVPANLDQRSKTVRVVLKIQSVNVDTNLQK